MEERKEKGHDQKNLKKIEKNFYRMLRHLDKKGYLDFDPNFDFISRLRYPRKHKYGKVVQRRFDISLNLYKVVLKFWDEDLAPFVYECLYDYYCMTCWRNADKNVIGMMIADSELCRYDENRVTDKLAIMSLFKRWCSWEELDLYRGTREYNYTEIAEAVREIRHGGWEKYFAQVTLPFIKSIAIYGAHNDELYGDLSYENNSNAVCDWERIAGVLNISPELNRKAVKFLIEDAYDYIWGCDCFCYNPFWMYGTRYYTRILQKVSDLPWKKWEKESKKFFKVHNAEGNNKND